LDCVLDRILLIARRSVFYRELRPHLASVTPLEVSSDDGKIGFVVFDLLHEKRQDGELKRVTAIVTDISREEVICIRVAEFDQIGELVSVQTIYSQPGRLEAAGWKAMPATVGGS
jgi:hypothetical protein